MAELLYIIALLPFGAIGCLLYDWWQMNGFEKLSPWDAAGILMALYIFGSTFLRGVSHTMIEAGLHNRLDALTRQLISIDRRLDELPKQRTRLDV
jgi:hypothetical protein